MAMAIDSELATFLTVEFPNDMDDVIGTRRLLDALIKDEIAQRGSLPPGVTWHDEVVSTDVDSSVPIRVYRNSNVQSPRGALLFFHGGAFVFGGLESEHIRCVRYAERAKCVVVSVDYRLAPEHPFPAGFNDGVAALAWLQRASTSLGVDATRIGVGGASAGGTLAAGIALRVRDEGEPPLKTLLLIYPATDNEASTHSMLEYHRCEPWDGERTQKMWTTYLSESNGDVSPYASIARANDLSNLPPTYIMTAEVDPLRDQAIAHAARLLEAGNTVELHHFARTFHGFDVVAPGSRLSERALDEQAAYLCSELSINDN